MAHSWATSIFSSDHVSFTVPSCTLYLQYQLIQILHPKGYTSIKNQKRKTIGWFSKLGYSTTHCDFLLSLNRLWGVSVRLGFLWSTLNSSALGEVALLSLLVTPIRGSVQFWHHSGWYSYPFPKSTGLGKRCVLWYFPDGCAHFLNVTLACFKQEKYQKHPVENIKLISQIGVFKLRFPICSTGLDN